MRGSVAGRIRDARAGEAPALQQIGLDADDAYRAAGHPELAGEPFPLPLLEGAIRERRLRVAVDPHDRPVGWILVSHAAPEPCVAQVAVAPSHGRRGVGTALMEDMLSSLRAAGHASVALNTQADIPWNAPWYARLGFEVVPPDAWTEDMRQIEADQREEGLDWSTRVHMRRALT